MVGLIAAALAKPMMLHDKMHALINASRVLHVERAHIDAVLMRDEEQDTTTINEWSFDRF